MHTVYQKAGSTDLYLTFKMTDNCPLTPTKLPRLAAGQLVEGWNFCCTSFLADWLTKVCLCAKKKFLALYTVAYLPAFGKLGLQKANNPLCLDKLKT